MPNQTLYIYIYIYIKGSYSYSRTVILRQLVLHSNFSILFYTALSRLKLESDITDCLENFLCLLKLLKKLRYGYCNISTCCEVLDCLLKVSGSPYSTKNQAELLKELSEIWIVKANYDNAIASAEQSAKLASELGDKKLEAEMYYILFKAQVLKGSMEEANVSLEKCINCSKKCGDELTMGMGTNAVYNYDVYI